MRRIAIAAASLLVAAVSAAEWKPVLPERAQFELGAYVFERNCAVCHGPRGDGQGEMAATLIPKPRSFRSGVFKYRSTPPGKLPTNDDLARIIRGGLSGTAMGMFTQLRDDEVRAVVEYVKSFSRKWRDPANYAPPLEVPPLPAWWKDAAQRSTHAGRGRQIFLATCATCHGEKADGKGPVAATLRDDWGEPLAPANLRGPLHSGETPRDLMRVLLSGIGGTPMVSFAGALSEEQRWEVIAHLAALRAARP